MAGDDASGDAGVGGNGFVAGVASDDAGAGMADDAGHDEDSGFEAERGGQLGKAGGVIVDDSAGRNSMDELHVAEASEGQRGRKGGRSGGDDF